MVQKLSRPLPYWAFPLLACALAGCGPSDNDPGPGGVTVGEARALDEAAEMLDERKAAPTVMGPTGTGEQSDKAAAQQQPADAR